MYNFKANIPLTYTVNKEREENILDIKNYVLIYWPIKNTIL